MSTDQSVLGPYCLKYKLPKYILKQKREQTTVAMNSGKSDNQYVFYNKTLINKT